MEPNQQVRVIMIHGVKYTEKSKANFLQLVPAFDDAGFNVITPKYGFIPAFVIGFFQWVDNRLADSMASFIKPDDIILGYSNGGTLAYIISQKVKVRGIILINPALDSSLAPNADFVHVYYNDGDLVTWASSFIPFHLWGDMGKVGYKGKWNKCIMNIDEGHPPEDDLPALDGHKDLFQPKNIGPWSKYMVKQLLISLGIQKE